MAKKEAQAPKKEKIPKAAPKQKKVKPPKAKKEEGGGKGKKLAIVFLALVLVGGVGAGGFFGWRFLSSRQNATASMVDGGFSLNSIFAGEKQNGEGDGTAANQGDPSLNPETEGTSPEEMDAITVVPMEGEPVTVTSDDRAAGEGAAATSENPSAMAAAQAGADVAGASTMLAISGSLPAPAPDESTQADGSGSGAPQAESTFAFSQETFSLPADVGLASSPLEQQVHADVSDYLSSLDDRPGVQMTSVILCGQTTSPDGYRRELVYALGNRYAVADTTLFDYGMLAGPMALDYDSAGNLVRFVLPQEGDSFEMSIETFCQGKTDVARRMTKGNYDLELLAKMVKNVSAYIQRNQLNVDFFRLGNQVYNQDGTLRMASVLQPELSSSQENVQETTPMTEEQLEADYQYYKDLPH